MTVSNDAPIHSPEDDCFALDPFAKSVAHTLSEMFAPEGVVLAITGPWGGAGKSSAVNLIRHHLKPLVESGSLQIVPFNPWWFPGSDALTLSFFQELSRAIGPSLPGKLKKSIATLGQGVSAVGAFAGALASLHSGPIGDLIAKRADFVGRATENRDTIDDEHRKVAEAPRAVVACLAQAAD
jgi:predicted KAP-like P-loop ATPase